MTTSNTFFLCFLLAATQLISAQTKVQYQIHSHNDYHQNVPFWNAYSSGLNSLEVDVFLKDNTLFVTHGEKEILLDRTIENLYLDPIRKVLSLNFDPHRKLQLLIDIKSEAQTTLSRLISVLADYPEITGSKNISIVISGNRPNLKSYPDYPSYILFDYQSLDDINDKKVLDKIALTSLNFKKYSEWNGKGRLTATDLNAVQAVIKKAHSIGKPFRFWGAPDSKTAWKVFVDLGVDFINTDMPSKSSTYLATLDHRVYQNSTHSKVYAPFFLTDQKNNPAQNVILLIGDGNGLSQISSAALANGGDLTLTQLKSIGFLKTQSADDFTTDSAAAGTAISTGTKTNNRAIGVDASQVPLQNITEFLGGHGFLSGCITTDEITGATPASFYAHRVDRSETMGIAEDLVKSNLSLFVGGGSKHFQNNGLSNAFTLLNDIQSIGIATQEKVGYFISELGVPSVLEGRGDLLAKATKSGLQFFKRKDKPFFLMIEAAQIDSNGHTNNVAGIVTEGIDFDKAISEAIKYADQTMNTLVIITADHETSGFSIPQGNLEHKTIEGDFTTHDHTGSMVPIFAYGPGSQEFQGVYENSELFGKIIKVLALKKQ